MKRTGNKIRRGLALKATKNSGEVCTYLKKSRGGFSNLLVRLRAKDYIKYHVRVYYGQELGLNGKPQSAHNEGTYTKKSDLLYMYRAFTEKPLLDDIAKGLI